MAAQRGQPSEEFGQIWQILLIHVQTLVSQAWRGLFEKFKNPESTEGSDPAMGKESRSKCIPGRQASSHQTVSPNPGDGKLYSKKTISLVWSDVFEKFKNPESIDWCALALEQGSGHWPPWGPSYGHSKEPRLVFSDFLGGLLIRSIYLGMLPTQYPHEPLS